MLEELLEDQAKGEIAEIYGEIRRYSGVPYVSSLQRYVATLPGVLEWLWAALRPAMESGVIPETGWRLAEGVQVRPAAPVPATALPQMGIDGTGLAAIRNVAANFVRVAPVNLVMGGCIHLLLNGARPQGAGFAAGWSPPAPLPAIPGNADPAKLAPAVRADLMQFATEIDGKPFIPALYRQVAHWPGFLAWLAHELGPRFADPEIAQARAAFRSEAWSAAQDIVARLPALPQRPGPEPADVPRVLAAVDRYGGTSPEMTMFGRLILDALPERM
jgi:hypothetical protein